MPDIALFVLRVGIGLSMLLGHGWGKLSNFSTLAAQFPDPIGAGAKVALSLAIFAEVFCSAALVLGIYARFAAVPLLVTMLVAFTSVHSGDTWQHKELAFVYGLIYITIIIGGPGAFDLLRPGKRSRRPVV